MYEKERLAYLKELQLRAALDDRTLQAIKLNLRTGQTTTPLTDMRSLDEKFADVELLKSRVRSDLLTITDAKNTNSIISSLGPAEMVYLASNFDALAKEIRPRYKMGILDHQFMQVLRTYIDQDALAPVVGRPVSSADLHASSALAPTRSQVNKIGALIQTATDAQATPAPAKASAAARSPSQAELIVDAAELGIPVRRIGVDGNRSGRLYSAEHLQSEIKKVRDEDSIERAPSDPGGRAFWASPVDSPGRALVYSPYASGKAKAAPKSGMGVKKIIMGRGVFREPLGRYTICARSLGDNIVKIRSQKGANVARFPTEKVSAKLGDLLRKMVSGGSLNFEDVGDLSDTEKRYLHKVAVGCDLTGKCPISAPKNDESEIEMDLFTKLRGEICAGNTNLELIRDFKKLLFKMKTESTLPSAQVNKCLLDLLSLGH